MYGSSQLLNQDEDTLWIKSKKPRKIKIVFDPYIFTLIILIFVLFTSALVYFTLIFFIPCINNFNHLTSERIPNEIDFIHQFLTQQNKTINDIESKMIIMNEIKINHIIQNLEIITTNLNVTQLQNNIQNIVNDLNKVIH